MSRLDDRGLECIWCYSANVAILEKPEDGSSTFCHCRTCGVEFWTRRF